MSKLIEYSDPSLSEFAESDKTEKLKSTILKCIMEDNFFQEFTIQKLLDHGSNNFKAFLTMGKIDRADILTALQDLANEGVLDITYSSGIYHYKKK